MIRTGIFFMWLLACGCAEENGRDGKEMPAKETIAAKASPVKKDSAIPADTVKIPRRKITALEQQLRDSGLVDVQELDSTIQVDLRYSTTHNFVGVDVYGDFDRCYLQPDVAKKLMLAQKKLKERYPYYSLVIYDAVRPVHIQQLMWDTLQLPRGEKTKYLSNPDNGSLHNYGAAVDLGIIDQNGIPLDMGTPFDFFGEKAHPVKEKELLESGELSQRQVFNREILRSVMYQSGFFGIQTEWWHFNSCRREEAARIYHIIP